MSFELETATNRESLRRVAIDPVSRVEGHLHRDRRRPAFPLLQEAEPLARRKRNALS